MSQHEEACSREGVQEGCPPPGTAARFQARDKICDPAPRGALKGGSGGVSPPGTAAVSKDEPGTVTKQTTGSL